MEYSINIRPLVGNSFMINIQNSNTILDLKKKIFLKKGYDVDKQKLIYGGNLLNNDVTILDYNLNYVTCIHLVIE